MQLKRFPARAGISLSSALAVLATPLALGFWAPAQAAVDHLVISEAYGGGGNSGGAYRNDFVELYNPTSSDIVMSNYSIQYRAVASTGAASGVTPLSGTVPAHGFFLVQQAVGADTTQPALPSPDVVPDTPIAMSGTNFQLWLASTTSPLTPPAGNVVGTGGAMPAGIVDLVGVGGTATSYEGSGRAPIIANATSAQRKTTAETVIDADDNAADFQVAAPTPKNSSDRYPEADPGGPLAAVDPGDKSVIVNQAMSAFALQATGGTAPYTWAATGLPAGVSVSSGGTVSGTPTAIGTSTVTATVTDSTSATATTEFDIVVTVAPVIPTLPIPEIQGTPATQGASAASPYVGQNVAVAGVVTARYATGGMNGFYIQTPGYDPNNDATPDASDALFVYQGTSPSYAAPAVGKHVTITSGLVSEFFTMTQVTVTNGANVTVRDATPSEAVIPGTRLPGTDCTIAAGDCLTGAALDAVREAHENEVFQPTDPMTVSDSYDGSPWGTWLPGVTGSSQFFGEIGLAANSDIPLYLPIDQADPGTPEFAARQAYNEAHAITLSDGVTGSVAQSSELPWLSKTHTVRTGAAVTFPKPAVFDFRNNLWKLQAGEPVLPGQTGAGIVDIEQDRPGAPEDVLGATGNVKIATFNMLNYFVHDAQSWAALPNDPQGQGGKARTCTYYTERGGQGAAGDGYPGRVTANTCTMTDTRNDPETLLSPGPRGAAQKCNCTDLTSRFADFERQEAKEVLAINAMDADVMSLEEVENPIKLGYGGANPTRADRDTPLVQLVGALNAQWESTHPGDTAANGPRWAYARSPRFLAQPTIAEQDAIRTAFIYNPRKIETVGESEILVNSAPMRNAREPLAQAFKRIGGNRDDGFIVIVNHFKSKSAPVAPSVATGDNVDSGNGEGWYNGDRIRQARALDAFAKAVSDDKGVPAVFLTGDFNAYGHEDPVKVLEAGGWTNLEPDNEEPSYSFGGLAGSLDHVFANEAAREMVTGSTIWPINANEPVYYEYSRFNYYATDLYDGTVPHRASDHNPEIIGVNAPLNPPLPGVDTVQILASNDFHGRILDDPGSSAAGAASMGEAVKSLRADNPNTVFAMAGDIIGASTFESFIQEDKPTLDALNAAGLDVSSAGNHEFDKGYNDLMERVMTAYNATTNPLGGANWPYLAANVRLESDNSYALASDRTDHGYDRSNGASWWKMLPDGRAVGFVGAVTEDLPSLVAPSALEGLKITSIVNEVNTEATRLKTDGCGGQPCDLVIELVHEGNATPDCSTVANPNTTFGKIVTGANDHIDAIVSGHTHLKYNCKVEVPGWSTRAVTKRPVVSAGQYGSNLNQLQFEYAPGTDELVNIRQSVLAMKDYEEDAATKTVVDAAVAYADAAGEQTLGHQTGPFQRARYNDPITSAVQENRGGESSLGNLVAEIQRWKTGADIAFMNPGGLRQDLMGKTPGSYPSDVTYRQAANVQPFANTLMTVDLTGAQIKRVLEEQWQRDPDGNVPSRPFLRLGTSAGFTFTYDPARPDTWTGDANPGNRITGMWLNGVPIEPAQVYTVAASNFLVAGGDNFRVLTEGANPTDTAKTDLEATVDYLAAHDPVSPDFGQHAVGVTLTTPVPSGGFEPGDTVTASVSSLAMTGNLVQADVQDASVRVYDGSSAGATALGAAAAPVNNALRSTPDDEVGTATVTFTLPATVSPGRTTLWLKGTSSGTNVPFTVPTLDDRAPTTVGATAAPITYGQAGSVVVTVSPSAATGSVEVLDGGASLGTATLAGGSATVAIAAGALEPGSHTLQVKYLDGDLAHQPSEGTVEVTVVKATPTISAVANPATVATGESSSIDVTVSATGFTPGGSVTAWIGGVQVGSAVALTAGAASIPVGPFATAGTVPVEIHYSGTARALGTGDDASIKGAATVTVTGDTTLPTPTLALGASTPGEPNGTLDAGEDGTVTVSITPADATGTVELFNGATKLGTATIAGGNASFVIPAGSLAAGTSHTLIVKYLGDASYGEAQGTITVTVAKAASTVTMTATPSTVTVAKDTTTVAVAVKAGALKPTGTVDILADGVKVASGALVNGLVTIVVGPFDQAGAVQLTARYSGDASAATAESAAAAITVEKQTATIKAKAPKKAKAGKKAKVTVTVKASGYQPTGAVKVKGKGVKAKPVALKNGKAKIKLTFKKKGKIKLTVVYGGDANTEKGKTKLKVKVKK